VLNAEPKASLNRLAIAATWHCLSGCAIGEVLGLVVATALGWGNAASIALAVVLAFCFGYALTLRPLLGARTRLRDAARIALAADTLSITVMEIVDNGFVLLVPGAMEAGLSDLLFWWSLGLALAIAFAAAFPVNRALIARGRGHAVAHRHHALHRDG
jgi:integral membrane sensor domain MASE1